MPEAYNIKSPYTLKIAQMRVGDIGYVGGGRWKRVKGAYYTTADRWVLPEDETQVVMLKKTVDGLFCRPIPWMEQLLIEKRSELPAEYCVRVVPMRETDNDLQPK